MDFTKIFSDQALTLEQFTTATKDMKLVDLTGGAYVAVEKYNEAVAKQKNSEKLLTEANTKLEGYDSNWKKTVEEAQTKAADEIKQLKTGYAVDSALMKAGVKDPAVVKPLIDMNKVAIDNGNLVGLSDQITAIQTSHPYLFNTGEQAAARAGSGMNHQGNDKPDTSKMSNDEYWKWYHENNK